MKKVNFTILTAFTLLLLTAGQVNAQTSRLQIIHNSPDYIIDTVDVWANSTRIANDLPFRRATQMIAIDSGDYIITIAKKFSTDTTAATSLLKVEPFRIDSGKTYLAFIAGVVDTTQYATNPNGADRSLSLVGIDSYKSTTPTSNGTPRTEVYFVNGTPDAAAFDLNRITGLTTKIGNDINFGAISDSAILATGNTVFNLTSADSTVFQGAFRLNTAPFAGKTLTIFTSGVQSSTGNPTLAKAMKVFAASSDGIVVELVKLTSDIQIVHNSADKTIDSVDIYINGLKAIANMGFRTATAFITLNAMVPQTIAVANDGSADATAAFYTTTLALDSSTNYYAIAGGVVNTANFASNPNGKVTAFKLFAYKGAKKLATFSKNVELLYFHGATDLQSTKITAVGQVQFLSKNDSYSDFHGYAVFSALDDLRFDISDAAADTLMVPAFANLASHQGKAGLAFMSGFKTIATNGLGDSAKLFIAWPSGKVDTVSSSFAVGLQNLTIDQKSVSVYPNPASNNTSISFTSAESTPIVVTLSDITGRNIYSLSANATAGANRLSIDLSAFNNGLYILNLTANNQVLSTKISVSK